MVVSRREYRSGLPFPFPGDLPHPGFKPVSLESAGRISTNCARWDVNFTKDLRVRGENHYVEKGRLELDIQHHYYMTPLTVPIHRGPLLAGSLLSASQTALFQVSAQLLQARLLQSYSASLESRLESLYA